ncbi:lipocalin family protein [Chryseobacterium sp.]|uniref:lipocalin family protein n=1 Tax=Chryseobacterium sp. TaxID=1871047 RepID=UPI0028A1FE2C|nr:lipocalin family protein [Chryseobacterium sp.]
MTSCSSGDDNDNTEQSITQSSILGKWYSDSSNSDNINLDFLSSGKVNVTYIGGGNNGQNITETGYWSISGNTLKIHWDSADQGLENWSSEVLTLTDSQLKWKEKIGNQFYTFSFHR